MQSSDSFYTVHTAYVPAPQDHSQHNQASPHAVLNSLVLLTMGIIMPETCRELINQEINTRFLWHVVGSIIYLL